MLTALSIRDIVLIERLDIEFSQGLTVLTGETGAGKSILLDSLSLALGGRGDASLVRHGMDKGQVIAVFDVSDEHVVRRLLIENDVDAAADDIVLRRVQSSDGRTRAFINDQPVSATLLRRIGWALVEIHGQHDDRALIEADRHRLLLDAYGGLEAESIAVSQAFNAMRVAQKIYQDHIIQQNEAAREEDYLRSACEELELLAPEIGEEEKLADCRQGMMQAEKVVSDLKEGHDMIAGSASPIASISSLVRRLERKSANAPALIEPITSVLDRALDALEESRSSLENALREADFDPYQLEKTEERLFALRAASRKFHVPVDGLSELAASMMDQLAALDANDEKSEQLRIQGVEAVSYYEEIASDLSSKRRHAATALEQAVNDELPALKLERAQFSVSHVTEFEMKSPNGIDQVEFWVQTNPGTRPGPMVKVASGGELSRFLLALKVVLADKGSAPTLVFDEIDTGVGGAVAEAIGVRLERLAEQVQVLSVTHAPQVAARAKGHFVISKDILQEDDRVVTHVQPIEADARLEEVARMLAGSVITKEARAAAKRLMAGTSL